MNENSSGSRRFLWLLPVMAIVAVTLVSLAKKQPSAETKMREENQLLQAQNAALQQELARLQSGQPAPAAEFPEPVAAPVAATNETAAVAAQEAVSPAPTQPASEAPAALPDWTNPSGSGLVLAGTDVAPVEGGLRATMRFTPNTTAPLGIVLVVVRLPPDSESRILSLTSADENKLSGVNKRVADDGKFAAFNATATSAEAMQFELSVSAPVVADVRGTCGIGPYQLEIKPGGAAVKKP